MPQSHVLLRTLPDVLTWRTTATEIYRRLNAVQAGLVSTRVRTLGEGCGELGGALSAMPSEMRRRIELAPQVFRQAFSVDLRVGRVRESLERFIAIERYIHGKATIAPGAGGRWSALADACIVEGDGGLRIPETSSSRPPAGNLAFAPVVRRTVLDGYSPLYAGVLRRGLGGELRAGETYPAGEFREVVARVVRALDVVESACEPARAMLDACVHVVALDWIPARPDKGASASIWFLPGMAGLRNVHSKGCSPEWLMDALVHEGIHAFLYKVHLIEPLFARDRIHPRITVVSPWSRRSLGVGSFTHACFVWFGLWNFWKQAAPHTALGSAFAERARKGFEGRSFLDNVSAEAQAIMQPDVIEAIRSMAAEANAYAGSAPT